MATSNIFLINQELTQEQITALFKQTSILMDNSAQISAATKNELEQIHEMNAKTEAALAQITLRIDQLEAKLDKLCQDIHPKNAGTGLFSS